MFALSVYRADRARHQQTSQRQLDFDARSGKDILEKNSIQ